MNYVVLWTPQAEASLAAAWMNAPDRNAVTVASDRIDGLLSDDPASQGDVLFDTVRALESSPLGVDFEVIEADRLVYVLKVWLVPG